MREQRERLVFIDETGTTTKMTRLRGRSAKGTRLNSKAPFGHWGTQTFVAGLRCDGLVAPWVIDAPMNRVIFETYVETQLAPTSSQATSSFSTTSPAIKVGGPKKRSGRKAHGSCSCLPIVRTSIQPKWPSQNSRPIYAPGLSEPSTIFGRPSATSAPPSRRKSAQTTSMPLDMNPNERPRL